MKTKSMQKLGLSTMAVVMGLGVGTTAIGTMAPPAQEVQAMGAVFGKTLKMKTHRAVYLNSSGKKEAVYYKGTTYTVQKSYVNGYYKVYIKGHGYKWMHRTSVLGDW